MNEPTECADIVDLLAEVATGAAGGADRARVLRHLASCDDCRQELDALARAADDVLLVAPARETPAGFEGAVLARVFEERNSRDHVGDRRRRRAWPGRRPALAAAALAAVFALGGSAVVWQATADDRNLAASYRDTLDIANGRYFTAAAVSGPGATAGTVFLYDGDPSWLFVVVENAPAATYDVVVTAEGRPRTVGTCTITARSGCSTGTTLDVAVHEIDDVSLVAPDGTTLRTAFRDE